MRSQAPPLTKKSLAVDEADRREWVKVGGFRSESEAVRVAVTTALAIRRLRDAIAGIQARGTFGRRLR